MNDTVACAAALPQVGLLSLIHMGTAALLYHHQHIIFPKRPLRIGRRQQLAIAGFDRQDIHAKALAEIRLAQR